MSTPSSTECLSSAFTPCIVVPQNEIDLLREILTHVEREHTPEEGVVQIRLAHVLRAYEAVLNNAHFQPADDTFFYRSTPVRIDASLISSCQPLALSAQSHAGAASGGQMAHIDW